MLSWGNLCSKMAGKEFLFKTSRSFRKDQLSVRVIRIWLSIFKTLLIASPMISVFLISTTIYKNFNTRAVAPHPLSHSMANREYSASP